MLDRAHRVDGVEARVAERQIPDVGHRAAKRGAPSNAARACITVGSEMSMPNARAPRCAAHARMRVFFASSHRSVLRSAGRRAGEVLGEEPLFVVRVVAC